MQAPSIPSATSTAAAQTKSNIDTATTQQELNMVNQVTPTGSLTYTQNGTNADGTPKYTATSALNQGQQNLLNTGVSSAQNLLGQINTSSQQPFQLNTATENKLDDLASQRLEPQIQRDQASLQQQLANKGVMPGTEAYDNAVKLQGQTQNDARNQLYLNGYTTAENASLQEANLPYQQFGELVSGNGANSSVGATSTPSAGVASTNVADLTNQQYQNQLSQYNGQMNALGSLGSTVGGWIFSDKRLKTDIHATGEKTPDGIPVKTFRYKGSPMMQMGVIAQDAEKKRPDAVRDIGGRKAVDYGKIGSPMMQMGEKKSPMLGMGRR